MMKVFMTLAMILGMSLIVAVPTAAQAMDACPHGTTVQSLQDCVQHAAEHGFISNQGIVQSLQVKLNAAEAALERDQPAAAINLLGAFVNQLAAQSGKQVDLHHAEHLRMHADMVIEALS